MARFPAAADVTASTIGLGDVVVYPAGGRDVRTVAGIADRRPGAKGGHHAIVTWREGGAPVTLKPGHYLVRVAIETDYAAGGAAVT